MVRYPEDTGGERGGRGEGKREEKKKKTERRERVCSGKTHSEKGKKTIKPSKWKKKKKNHRKK